MRSSALRADALRFTLITGNSPGNDTRFSADKVEAARNFANKIWNASRFVLMNLEVENTALPPLSQLEPEDKWILSKMNRLVEEVTENLESYDLGVALSKLYDFFWDSFCDWYIELCKARLFAEDDNPQAKLTAQSVLAHVLFVALRLLHPFMPFVTEKIWQYLPGCEGSIMMADWPKEDMGWRFEAEEKGHWADDGPHPCGAQHPGRDEGAGWPEEPPAGGDGGRLRAPGDGKRRLH